jgi:hypothetical protein
MVEMVVVVVFVVVLVAATTAQVSKGPCEQNLHQQQTETERQSCRRLIKDSTTLMDPVLIN